MRHHAAVWAWPLALLGAAAAPAQNAAPVVVARTQDDAAAAMLPGVMNRMTVVVDAAHGGADVGARMGDAGGSSLQEKDVTLGLALKLQALLLARGFNVVMTRSNDAAEKPGANGVPLTIDDRAGLANHARASACLMLHAAGSGHGVHLYSSELDGVPAEPALLSWSNAQAAWVVSSAQLEQQIGESLRQAGVPRILSRASVRPVDSLTCPAVVIELAPEGESVRSVGDPAYQQRVAEGVAAALERWSKQVQPPPRIPSTLGKPKPQAVGDKHTGAEKQPQSAPAQEPRP